MKLTKEILNLYAPGDEAESEAFEYIKKTFLHVWSVLGYPRNESGFYMTRLAIERLLYKLFYDNLFEEK